MNTIESIKQLLRQACDNATGLTTVFGPAQGPEPANQFCLLTLMGIDKEDYDISTWTASYTEPLTEHQRCESTLNFELQVRGKNAMANAEKFIAYLDSELRDIDLWPYVGSGGHDDIQNVTVYHQGKMLEVAQVTFYIHTTLPKQNSSEYFDILDINVKNRNNTDVITIRVPEEN